MSLRRPMEPLSRALFLAGRGLFRALVALRLQREAHSGAAPSWQGYAQILRTRPAFFHYVMFQGPRWNPHAVLGVLRGLRVRQRLSIQIRTALESARAGSVVVYGQGARTRTQTHVRLDRATDSSGFCHLDLEPGLYSLGARYYECSAHPRWPAIAADDLAVAEEPLADEAAAYQSYLEGLRAVRSPFYRAVHAHVFAALREPQTDSRRLRELVLPVGNPDTAFRFGYLPQGASVVVDGPAGSLERNLLYLTCLDTASLPRFWTRIETLPFSSPALDEGMYLLRLQPTEPGSDAGVSLGTRVLPPLLRA